MAVFHYVPTQIPKTEMPLIVIGLGGSGADALRRIKRTLGERFIHAPGETPKRTAYLMVDSDSASKQGFDDSEWLDINQNAGRLLEPSQRANLSGCIKEWLDPQLTTADLGHGAGTIRQIARLYLFIKAQEFVSRVSNMITQVTRQDVGGGSAITPLNIVICAGISGGTGSGMLLDAAYLARRAYLDSGCSLSLRVDAYVIMPDLTIDYIAGKDPNKQLIYASNSFAALKELDYWMNFDAHRHTHVQHYTEGSQPIEYTWGAPFDWCTLLSAKNCMGTPIPDAYSHAMDIIAESLMHYFAGEAAQPEGDDGSGSVYSLSSARSNEEAQILVLTKRKPKYYGYRAIGAYSNASEQQNMFDYEALKAFDTLEAAKAGASALDGGAAAEFFSKLLAKYTGEKAGEAGKRQKTEETALFKAFRQKLPARLSKYTKEIVHDLKMGKAPHQEPLADYAGDVLRQRGKWFDEITAALREEIIAGIQAAIRDPQRGPWWCHEALSHPEHGFLISLQRYLERTQADYERAVLDAPRALELAGKELSAFQQLHRLRNPSRYPKSYEAYMGHVKKLYDLKQMECFCEKWRERLKSLHEMLKVYAEDVLVSFLNGYEQTRQFLRERIVRVEKEIAEGRANEFIGFHKLQAYIDAAYENVTTSAGLRDKLLETIAEQSFALRDEIRLLPVDVDRQSKGLRVRTRAERASEIIAEGIAQTLSASFAPLHTKSLDNLLVDVGDCPDPGEYMEKQFAPRMQAGACQMLSVTAEFKGLPPDKAVNYAYISVPKGVSRIVAGIKRFSADQRPTIKESDILDRIFWLNTSAGLPLCAYFELERYEQAYNARMSNAGAHGYHLVLKPYDTNPDGTVFGAAHQDVDRDWRLLPSPVAQLGERQYSEARKETIRALQQASSQGMLALRASGPDISQLSATLHWFGQSSGELSQAQWEDMLSAAMEGLDPIRQLSALEKLRKFEGCQAEDIAIPDCRDRLTAFAQHGDADTQHYAGMATFGLAPEALAKITAANEAAWRALVFYWLSDQPRTVERIRRQLRYLRELGGRIEEVRVGAVALIAANHALVKRAMRCGLVTIDPISHQASLYAMWNRNNIQLLDMDTLQLAIEEAMRPAFDDARRRENLRAIEQWKKVSQAVPLKEALPALAREKAAQRHVLREFETQVTALTPESLRAELERIQLRCYQEAQCDLLSMEPAYVEHIRQHIEMAELLEQKLSEVEERLNRARRAKESAHLYIDWMMADFIRRKNLCIQSAEGVILFTGGQNDLQSEGRYITLPLEVKFIDWVSNSAEEYLPEIELLKRQFGEWSDRRKQLEFSDEQRVEFRQRHAGLLAQVQISQGSLSRNLDASLHALAAGVLDQMEQYLGDWAYIYGLQ